MANGIARITDKSRIGANRKADYLVCVDDGRVKLIPGSNMELPTDMLCVKNVPLTLLASGWSAEQPYDQTITLPDGGMFSDQPGEVYLSSDATDAQYNEATRCGLRLVGQTEETITVRAMVDKPSIDLPITLELHFNIGTFEATFVTKQELEDATGVMIHAIPDGEKGIPNGIATLDENGKLDADQVPELSYIPSSEKGNVNGVATLNAMGKIPAEQLSDMNYIENDEKGAAYGVATLGEDGKVPSGQIPELDYVKPTRKINNKTLDQDITLTAADVKARPDTWKPSSNDMPLIPIEKGGTGASDVAGARANLGLSLPLPIESGGTGATTKAAALQNLGITCGTEDLIAGTSSLETGAIYLVYE